MIILVIIIICINYYNNYHSIQYVIVVSIRSLFIIYYHIYIYDIYMSLHIDISYYICGCVIYIINHSIDTHIYNTILMSNDPQHNDL